VKENRNNALLMLDMAVDAQRSKEEDLESEKIKRE
jgi:hypothetical protein